MLADVMRLRLLPFSSAIEMSVVCLNCALRNFLRLLVWQEQTMLTISIDGSLFRLD